MDILPSPILHSVMSMGLLPQQPKKENPKKPEEKDDTDLEIEDRLYLVSKKLEDTFLMDIFLDILKTDNISIQFEKSIMNSYVIEDIELFGDHYNNHDKGIFSKINRTKTKMGEFVLKQILSNPIYDIEILKRRQKMILDIGRLHREIQPKLVQIREIENDLIWFWNDNNMRHLDLMNDLIYFNYDFIPFFNLNDILNRNERALMITNIYKIVIAPITVALTPLLSLLVPLIIFVITQKKLGINMNMTDIIRFYFKTIYNFNPMEMFAKPSLKTTMMSFLSKAFYFFMYLQNIYYTYQSSKSTHQMINVIHEKMNKINKYIQLSEEIKNICVRGGIKRLDTFTDKDEEVNGELIETKKIFENKTNTFDKDPSLFSHKGVILRGFQEFRKEKRKLHSCFQYIASIDAIQSIYQLLEESSETHPYCLTEYLENRKRPSVNMKDIWHPYLDSTVSKNTVKNDLLVKNNVLITGPNAGGKSTFIKSVIVNILMSQTICMNSSENFKITPFKMIETYLHIPDSKGSQSLFEAEMYRSRDYLDRLKELDENDFSFIVLDEIFSSTNYIEGYSGAYAILKKISSFLNTLSMTTTHYSDLEILERDTNGRFENYRFEVTYDENREILFNYKLNRGVSRQYIALDLLKKNGFDDDLIETAIEMSKKVSVVNEKMIKEIGKGKSKSKSKKGDAKKKKKRNVDVE